MLPIISWKISEEWLYSFSIPNVIQWINIITTSYIPVEVGSSNKYFCIKHPITPFQFINSIRSSREDSFCCTI